jgi:DNA-binding transcriptional regulator YiaG
LLLALAWFIMADGAKQSNLQQRLIVKKNEFKKYRKRLNKTQKQIAELLGTSLKAIHSYEQGWRTIPAYIERQLFFLVSMLLKKGKGAKPCWKVKKCSATQKTQCPAWEFGAGDFCWLINGTVCDGTVQQNWNEKMKICRSCEVFSYIL